MRRTPFVALLLFVGASGALVYAVLSRDVWPPKERDAAVAAAILATYRPEGLYAALEITYPLDETLFPPEIIAPTFRWKDPQPRADTWLVTIAFQDGQERLTSLTADRRWRPSHEQWEAIKRRSLDAPATVGVIGVKRAAPTAILSAGRTRISTSKDEVGAPIFYREVNLPFNDAVKDPSNIRWRFGHVGAEPPPPIVLQGLPVCGNCHSFSANGRIFGMDVDYANDKGSYVIAPVSEEIVLDKPKIITWCDYRREDGEPTFGLLSQLSPSGDHIVSTVKDLSVFVPRPDLTFSQLFFPLKGILCVYHRPTGRFEALPGADDKEFVQSNPTWSPDGKHIVFARSRAANLRNVGRGRVLLTPEECREYLQGDRLFKFDLYRIPFNDGKGGKPEPIKGASQNGMSNYFPKYSPDGKWIVFCKAKSFMLLQPDSQLYILPAAGGEARKMRCNTPLMNSWHSWSPNGKWLVFSSKANGPYTQLFLTHVDTEGESTPPVVLEQFTAPDRAGNIPEFVNLRPDAIRAIREQFVDDLSFVRAGGELLRQGDAEGAERAYRKALGLNPRNAEVHNNLAVLLRERGMLKDAEAHAAKAVECQPTDAGFHNLLGEILFSQGNAGEAIRQYREALRMAPEAGTTRTNLGLALSAVGELKDGAAQFAEAIRLDPKSVRALIGLASIRAAASDPALRDGKEAVALASAACTLTEHKDSRSLDILAAAYAEDGQFPEAVQTAREALRLSEAARDHEFARQIRARIELYARSERIPADGPRQPSGEDKARRKGS